MNQSTLGYKRSTYKWEFQTEQAKKNVLRLSDVLLKADKTPYLSPYGYFYTKDKNVPQTKPRRLKRAIRSEAREPNVWLRRSIGTAFILGFFLWIYIVHAIETSKVDAFYWPIVPTNEVYASMIPRDLPALDPVKVEMTTPETQEAGLKFRGKASYYSVDGCLGCKPYYDENGVYYLTANGDRFDDNALTLAVPAEWVKEGRIELGTVVKVTNLDNGKRVLGAVINDTGGFGKYNRIADLSKALYNELEVKTDVSTIEIEVLPILDRVGSN